MLLSPLFFGIQMENERILAGLCCNPIMFPHFHIAYHQGGEDHGALSVCTLSPATLRSLSRAKRVWNSWVSLSSAWPRAKAIKPKAATGRSPPSSCRAFATPRRAGAPGGPWAAGKTSFPEKRPRSTSPPGAQFSLTAASDHVEGRLCSAPGGEAGPLNPMSSRPTSDRPRSRLGGIRRQVHDIIDESRPARHLVVGETFNEPGLWSSYPPHKHDVDNPPVEYKMEEIYLFKVSPSQGFGVQALYSKDPARPLNEAHIIKENTRSPCLLATTPWRRHPATASTTCGFCRAAPASWSPMTTPITPG